MTSIITGDIIRSRRVKSPRQWLKALKEILSAAGDSPKAWEIYRGDSFQVEIKNPANSLMTAIRIKANIRRISNMDVRMAIGIGKKDYSAAKITESSGEAFVNSGEKLESLKREKVTLAVKSPWNDFDREMNVCLKLALIAMDSWTPSSAEVVSIFLKKKDLGQLDASEMLGIAQSSVSERQKRARYAEIMEMEALFREKIKPMLRK